MKKPIKLREGKYVFGNFKRARYCDIDEEFIADEDNVAKFAAYDKYGRRVYEGDILGVPSGTEIADMLIKSLRTKGAE